MFNQSTGDEIITANLFAGLGIVVMERLDNGSFRMIGSVPDWFMRINQDTPPMEDGWRLEKLSLFLENFLIDAEYFWSENVEGALKSGPWTEIELLGECYLEATAVCLGSRKILLIEFPSTAYEEKHSLIQKGRDNCLHYLGSLALVEEELRHNAFHDQLTGLANRALFMERLKQSIEHHLRRKDYLFAVLFLDLDRFKVVNDSLGHMLGDQLLIAISRRLKLCLRPVDTVARFGGDEFTILLDNIQNVETAIQVASRIQKELTLPFNVGGHEVFTAASIGIAPSTLGYDKPEDLLRDADVAMYRAKALGKGRSEVFDPSMHTKAVALLQLETDLRQALNRLEFRLHYQPIVALTSGKITGFEALVRWQHPQRGLVSPAEFIPVAEETGLIVPLGYWVLSEACRQMRAWQVRFPEISPLTISVNFSSKQFLQNVLITQISSILQETGLDTCSLAVEITESVIMENTESVSIMLSQLQAWSIQLSLDDFGTGYSSLSYLHRFEFNTLKIDRSFVNRMGIDGESWEIVRTIITLAHSLNMNVTAEGVETIAQLDQLKALKCDRGQGYLFSKPVDCEAAGALIAENAQ